MIRLVRDLREGWDKFFFAPTSSLPVATFRFLFGLNAFIMYSIRFTDWKFYFTNEGIVPNDLALQQLPEFFRAPMAYFPVSDSATFALHLLYLVVLFLLCLGVFARAMALIGLFCHLAFMQRNYGIHYGADIITSFWLLYLVVAESDRSLSLRAWWRSRREGLNGNAANASSAAVNGIHGAPKSTLSSSINDWFTTIGTRLIQIQLCLIYGFTGLEKMKGPSWWDGTAVWAVVGNEQLSMFDHTWLKHIPLAIAFMTFSTLFFEIYFPVLVWLKPIRKWVLIFGVLLHAGIALSVGLIFFSIVMISSYFVFVDHVWLKSALRRLRVPDSILGPS